eukprot:m.85137 g.85137  ORF g.85137 m.85137 type:complete len:131 (-) comp14830_c0_seq3:86-478(-)
MSCHTSAMSINACSAKQMRNAASDRLSRPIVSTTNVFKAASIVGGGGPSDVKPAPALCETATDQSHTVLAQFRYVGVLVCRPLDGTVVVSWASVGVLVVSCSRLLPCSVWLTQGVREARAFCCVSTASSL